jgi:hypothetical protein
MLLIKTETCFLFIFAQTKNQMRSLGRKVLQCSFTILLVMVLICSCSKSKSDLKKYGPELQSVMRDDLGTFRGFNLGQSMDTILAKEIGTPAEADDSYLYYEFKLKDSNSFNISYNFDEKGLREIQSDIYIHDPQNTERVINAFKTYFDDHFGESELHQGFNVWTVRSEKYEKVRINLSDESGGLTVSNAPGKISLWIYPDTE